MNADIQKQLMHVRKEILVEMLALTLPPLAFDEGMTTQDWIGRLVRHSKGKDLKEAYARFQGLEKDFQQARSKKERMAIARRQGPLMRRMNRLARELGMATEDA